MRKLFIASVVFLLVQSGSVLSQSAPIPYGALPSDRQLKWHELDMYGLVHFTPTTFENKELQYLKVVLR